MCRSFHSKTIIKSEWVHTMKVSVPASAARTPPDTGASNMTGFTQWSTNNTTCQFVNIGKNKKSQSTYLKRKLWYNVSKFHCPPCNKNNIKQFQTVKGPTNLWFMFNIKASLTESICLRLKESSRNAVRR